MMMKMLEAGGIPALTDGIREADEDNPKGYYEFERVKKLPEDTAWLPDAVGKAVKMVFTLLHDLPEGYTYKVVFMRRQIQEILDSQRTMLERSGRAVDVDDEEMRESFEFLLERTLNWLDEQPHFEVEYVWYNDVMNDPEPVIQQLNTFFDGALNTAAMLDVVDTSLYRNRAED